MEVFPGLYFSKSDIEILWRDKTGVDKEKYGMVLLVFRRGIQRIFFLRNFISVFSFKLRQSQKFNCPS